MQVCVPLIQSTLSLDSSAALQGTPLRVPANQSLASATPAPKSGIKVQACFQLYSGCSKPSVLFNVFRLFHLRYIIIENSDFTACSLESSEVVIYTG